MGVVDGTIERAGDEDWIRATLAPGVSYRIALESPDTSASFTVRTDVEEGGFSGAGQRFDTPSFTPDGVAQTVVTPAVGGDFYVAVNSFAGATDYTLTVEPQADDFADSAATSARLAPGQSLEGRHETAGDDDWVGMTLAAGQTYRIEIEAAPAAFATLFGAEDGRFAEEAGRAIFAATPVGQFGSGRSQIVVTPRETSEYFLSLQGPDGDWTVTLAEQADDFADTDATAGASAVGETISGTIETEGDRDWIRIPLEAGVTYRAEAVATEGGGAGFAPSVAVFSADDSSPGFGDALFFDAMATGRVEGPVFTAAVSGDYFFEVSSNLTPATGGYTLSVSEQVDDFADTTATDGLIAPGQTVSGTIEVPGDSDWIAADLSAGVTYRASLSAVSVPFGFVDLRAGSETDGAFPGESDRLESTLAGAAIPGAPTEIVFTPRVDARYYFIVPSSEFGLLPGDYTLALAEQADDFADNADTEGSVAPGATASGVIETAGDEDWFRVDLAAGTSYLVTATPDPEAAGLSLSGAVTFVETREDGEFEDGFRIDTAASDPTSFTTVQTVLTPRTDASFYIRVAGATGSGAYTVSVAEVEDDFADTSATLGTVEAGGSGLPLIEGGEGPDMLAGTPAAEEIRALGGDDLIAASGGDDLIQGGAGTDTVVYPGAASIDPNDTDPRAPLPVPEGATRPALSDAGALTVSAPDGTDRLTGVERVEVADGAYLYDIGIGPELAALYDRIGAGEIGEEERIEPVGDDLATVYRLYGAAYGRTPDEAGLRFWLDLFERDQITQRELAEAFITVPEFQLRYDGDPDTPGFQEPSDEEYISLLYDNALRRELDEDGFAFWLAQLESGAFDRVEMLIFFADSPENVTRTRSFLEDGVVVLPEDDMLM